MYPQEACQVGQEMMKVWDILIVDKQVISIPDVRAHISQPLYKATAVDSVENISSYEAFSCVDAEKWTILCYTRKSVSKEDVDSCVLYILTSREESHIACDRAKSPSPRKWHFFIAVGRTAW
ncbi:hypothetical protein PHYBLDRAFT_171820 [Phycomyces blakesleeanus NRRL 1555(-)]|uniref:Uncharacterized protein n=1 Tax=Phycomyces blakesleeanus (strain ATCC 8743b / DSM 1359 / FGSC 10004 / NBRC 33097 / NRRL 1555) TaxID=763407 RepID=A0A162TN41_PHYB8|nr:hypothetical protein PHYBLDRAFT_171820 [Phycomyces blakesleeanus NRRL 1555(-)]OAD69802.1 hypothetical protein PHYBLDRAFT_171820 [Phycomyces blakesleeanus NRRL 1555(-)]|eukprot:XP_018287842.1 hypothetical protein PHYBLDRAFT_171820 [Phycomyces blakesleeanus NRRL 1555(-)]